MTKKSSEVLLCEIEIMYQLSPTIGLTHPASLRPTARLVLELERFVHDHATCIESEKLWSEGVAMYAYSISVYYVLTGIN